MSHVVSWGLGPDGVLCGEGDAAHGDDGQDAELKVLQGQDVVAAPPKPGGHRGAGLSPLGEVFGVPAKDTNTHGLVVDIMKQELKGGMGLGPSSSPPSSSSSFFSSLFFWSVLAFLFTGRNEGEETGSGLDGRAGQKPASYANSYERVFWQKEQSKLLRYAVFGVKVRKM